MKILPVSIREDRQEIPDVRYTFCEGKYVDNRWIMNGTGGSYVMSKGGKTTLIFEYVQKNHERYILVYGVHG